MKHSILIVDDESVMRLSLKKLLEKEAYQVAVSGDSEESLQMARSIHFDLAIVDLKLKDKNGVDLINELKRRQPHLESILITGESSIHVSITEAINKGIFHFISKPFEPEIMLSLVKKLLKQKELIEENKNLKRNIKKHFSFSEIIGQSPKLLELTENLRKIGKSSSHVLITGESGTGKELAAKSLHCVQDIDRPFVSVNCGAIPRELLESEFFGHVKGSFTGAIKDHKGYFAEAEGGTLFLDEIATMDLGLQVKLLRVLQEKVYRPVGSNKDYTSNVRVIAATNMDLEEEVKKGTFREDLYYRLNIIPLKIPPLRQRREDIPLLTNHFLKQASKGQCEMGDEAMRKLCNFTWPGNIRELQNVIERLCVFKEKGIIEVEDLPLKLREQGSTPQSFETIDIPVDGMDFNKAVDAYENSIIEKALERTKWNKRQAAKLLKLNRTTLIEKIKKKGLKAPSEEA